MGENVGTMGAKPLLGAALRTKICANEGRKCAYIEVSFELKRRPYKYFMNLYLLSLSALRKFEQIISSQSDATTSVCKSISRVHRATEVKFIIAPRAQGRGTPGRAGGRMSRIKEIKRIKYIENDDAIVHAPSFTTANDVHWPVIKSARGTP